MKPEPAAGIRGNAGCSGLLWQKSGAAPSRQR